MERGQGKEGEEATNSAEDESVHQQFYRDQQYAVTPVGKKQDFSLRYSLCCRAVGTYVKK